MTPAEITTYLEKLSDTELEVAIVVAETMLKSRRAAVGGEAPPQPNDTTNLQGLLAEALRLVSQLRSR
jgi:hypothetical protein